MRVGWEKRGKTALLTLKFLGDIDETQLRNLIEAVCGDRENFQISNLQIAGNGAFSQQTKRADFVAGRTTTREICAKAE
jgi:2'-5' RNA ligase